MLVAKKMWAVLWAIEEMSSPFIQTRLVVCVWRPNMVRAQRGCTREDTYTCTNNDTLPIWEVGVLNPNH